MSEEAAEYEWSAFYDDDKQIYYYNSVTEESTWDPPAEGFNPPVEDEAAADLEEDADTTAAGADAAVNDGIADRDDENDQQALQESEDEGDGVSQEPPDEAIEDEAAVADTTENGATTGNDEAEWVAYKDDEGLEYYYNSTTGETQWEKPDAPIKVYEEVAEEYEEQAAEASDTFHGEEQVDSKEEQLESMEVSGADEEEKPIEEEVEEEAEIDEAVKRAQDAERALKQPDSILEPGCMINVTEFVTSDGGNPQKAISLLLESYQGQTAICGLLSRWLADIRVPAVTAAATSDQQVEATVMPTVSEIPSQAIADDIRTIVQGVINKIVKERFSKEAGDSILDLSKSEAAFLEEMMDSPRWRQLLIDLAAVHKDSAVLMYCLRSISKRGHHREIAKRVNQSDHFAVFNAMLLSELTAIGTLAMSAGSDHTLAIGLNEMMNDLRRANSSTSYTYLYAVEMLRYLMNKLEREVQPDAEDRLSRVLRKWQALSQDLESTMMDPSASSSIAGVSPLFRKRRLEVALTISDLHQRQRRRRRNPVDLDEENESTSNLETSLLAFLRRYSIGIQIDASVLDTLLPQGLDLNTAAITGRLLIEHPLATRALLGYLYKPGSTRVIAPTLKNKCSRLVALAVLAAEKSSRAEMPGHEEGEAVESVSDEVALTRMILEASQICEQLESMVSFLVTTETNGSTTKSTFTSSPGQKLCQLALKCAAVAQGVMLWAREFTHGPEFAASASFPTLSGSILSLVRIISMQHPFTRRDALQVGLAFLHHSNPDISYTKVNAIKEQSLRMLLCLLTKGEVVPVLTSITNRLERPGSSDLDASLVRYFVAGLLEVVRPPVSIIFMRVVGSLLTAPKCMDAVRSSYFGEPHRSRLTDLLKSFNTITAMDGSDLAPAEYKFISSLLTAYQIN